MRLLKWLYELGFGILSASMRVFAANRARIRRIARQPRLAKALKIGMLSTLLLWLAIAFIFGRESGTNRLTEAVKQWWPESGEPSPTGGPELRRNGTKDVEPGR